MSYHMIEQPSYNRRPINCGPECGRNCQLQDQGQHHQDYATTLCGREVIRYRDEYCASGIAKPEWNHDWCRECIMMVQWTPEETEIFHQKGLLTETQTQLAGIAIIAAMRKMDWAGREPAWQQMLNRARTNLDQFDNPPVREWLQEVLTHLDQDGPIPQYWPDDVPREQMAARQIYSIKDAISAVVSPTPTSALEMGIDLPDLNYDHPPEIYRQRLSNNRNRHAGGGDAGDGDDRRTAGPPDP